MIEFLKAINGFNLEIWLLYIGIFVFFFIIYKWHTDKSNVVDVRSLLMTGDKMSLSKMGQFVAMIVSTWVIIYQTRAALLTEWLFTGYMLAWAGTGVVNKFLNKTNSQPDK